MAENVLEGFYVAGVKFHDLDEVKDVIEPGDIVSLEPDPFNEYDSEAIKVVYDGTMIGFVPARLTKFIHPLMNRGDHYAEIVQLDLSAQPWKQLKIAIRKYNEDDN